jgi:hypothetical protein
MSEEFGVDTEGLMRAVPQIASLAGQLDNVYGTLYGKLIDLGEPWGGDSTGETIAGNYLPAADTTLEAAKTMRFALLDTGDGLNTMAVHLQDTELENLGSINLGTDPVDPAP